MSKSPTFPEHNKTFRPLGLPEKTYIPNQDPSVEPQEISEYIERFRFHPEFPYQGVDGLPCSDLTKGLLTRREITASGFVYSGKAMVDEDDIKAITPDFDQVQIIYGKTEIPIQLIMQVLRDVPREFAISILLGPPESEVRKALTNPQKDNPTHREILSTKRKIEKWLSGSVKPKDARGLVDLVVRYAKSMIDRNVDNLSTEDIINPQLLVFNN